MTIAARYADLSSCITAMLGTFKISSCAFATFGPEITPGYNQEQLMHLSNSGFTPNSVILCVALLFQCSRHVRLVKDLSLHTIFYPIPSFPFNRATTEALNPKPETPCCIFSVMSSHQVPSLIPKTLYQLPFSVPVIHALLQ